MNLENLTEIAKDPILWAELELKALKSLKGSLEFAKNRPDKVAELLTELESTEIENWVNNLNADPYEGTQPYEVTLNAMNTINSYFRLEA